MYHYRTTRNNYNSKNTHDKITKKCPFPFCNSTNTSPVIEETQTMFIIANRVSYDIFEGMPVAEHLMVIPKRHIESLAEFNETERAEQFAICAQYEANGYNIYARGKESVSRSVKHQHTHLIKTNNNIAKGIIYLKKPYALIRW